MCLIRGCQACFKTSLFSVPNVGTYGFAVSLLLGCKELYLVGSDSALAEDGTIYASHADNDTKGHEGQENIWNRYGDLNRLRELTLIQNIFIFCCMFIHEGSVKSAVQFRGKIHLQTGRW